MSKFIAVLFGLMAVSFTASASGNYLCTGQPQGVVFSINDDSAKIVISGDADLNQKLGSLGMNANFEFSRGKGYVCANGLGYCQTVMFDDSKLLLQILSEDMTQILYNRIFDCDSLR